MSNALLECRNLAKRFEKDGQTVDVLRGVDLAIAAGDTLAIKGSSGAGKSTLLHVLGTLEPVSSGKIFFAGQDLSAFNSEKLAQFRNKELGFIFQFHYLLQEFTALENVLMPALISGDQSPALRKRAQTLLAEVGLSHRLLHRPAELSGGEQQRVALARAMIMQPRLILADEPTGNLDRANAKMVQDLLHKLNRDHGVTVILVTHDQELAHSFSRQITMSDGQILAPH
jgi:lipoprotein-releasing system ATP-binding protein